MMDQGDIQLKGAYKLRFQYGKLFIGSPRYCNLCGMGIPGYVVDPNHPLFGTIDHTVPLSKGGRNVPCNRRPAHKACNSMKGAKPHSYEASVRMRATVARLLGFLEGEPVNAGRIKRAAARASALWRFNPPPNKAATVWTSSRSQMRWDDDGGAGAR